MVTKHMTVVAGVVSAAVSVMSWTAVTFLPSTAAVMAAQDAQPAAAPPAKPAAPQDAKTVLASAAKAMGADTLKTIAFTGAGSNAGIGQNRNPDTDWPLVRMKSYTREIDFAGPASRTAIVRTQNGNDTTQEQVAMAASPWAAQYDVWLYPFAFLKGAMAAGSPTIESKTLMGLPYSVVTFLVQNKYKVSGYIDDKNMVYKVETWVDNPVLGDMLVEAVYTDYKDFTGVKVPTTIVNKQGGRNTLLLIVGEVKPNAPVSIQAPQQVQATPAVTVQTQKIATGVYYLTGGTHHSVVVEFADHLAVIEAPQNEARSLAVIKEIRKSVSKKPIRYIINTHHHFDHSGGLRTYVEDGAIVITHDINKAFYEKVLSPTAARTLNPDSLALEKKKIPTLKIETVTDKKVLMDKERTLELHLIKDSPHNDGILMAYLPIEKILVEADVYTPPAANAPAAAAVNPALTNLVTNIERLKLDVDRILPLHGPGAVTKADLYKAAGKPAPATGATK
jgi:glyoxylase-like metal-dependent hydrolase (beta-lactamase superfamily II)